MWEDKERSGTGRKVNAIREISVRELWGGNPVGRGELEFQQLEQTQLSTPCASTFQNAGVDRVEGKPCDSYKETLSQGVEMCRGCVVWKVRLGLEIEADPGAVSEAERLKGCGG